MFFLWYQECRRQCTVEPVLFFYMLAIFAQYSVFQELVYSRVCLGRYDSSICTNLQNSSQEIVDDVQTTSSTWILLGTISTIIPSIVIALYLGSWSDRFGRKWPVAVPPLGGALGSVVYIIMASYPGIPVGYICLGSIFPGITGGFTSCMMSCASYISSTTTESQRTVRLSRLEAMTYLGGTIGPFISALLLSSMTLAYAFLFMLICYLAAILYVIFVIDEFHSVDLKISQTTHVSTKTKQRASRTFRESNSTETSALLQDDIFASSPLENGNENFNECCCHRYLGPKYFLQPLKTCCKERPNGGRTLIIVLLVVGFVTMTVTAGEPDVGFLFARDQPLSWTPEFYSYFIGFKFGIGSLVLLLGMSIFRKFQLTDVTICLIGTVSRMLGLVCFGFSTTTIVAFLVPSLTGLFSFMSIPTIRAMISKLVEPHEQGKMFAFVAIMEDVCTLTASALFNGLYPLFRSVFHGFIFQVAAISLVIPVGLLWSIRNKL